MERRFFIIIATTASLIALGACSGTASSVSDSASAGAGSASEALAEAQTAQQETTQARGATPPVTPAVPIATVNSAPAYPYVAAETPSVPDRVIPGMKVSDALRVPGATQTVSAIMTGGKITGTVVVQWKGKSWYTNVDFAEEGGFANGTRYTDPEEVQAFIEVACSDQAVPADFTDEAVITDQIR